MKHLKTLTSLLLLTLLISCGQESKKESAESSNLKSETMFTPLEGNVKIMNVLRDISMPHWFRKQCMNRLIL